MNSPSHRTNQKDQKLLRQTLRNNATAPEAILWRVLKGKQIEGLKFKRQFGLGPYVLDFYCPEIKLCIELDGDVHKTHEQAQYDETRSRFINENNIKVLRFENDVVYRNTNAIVEAIKMHKKTWEEKKDWRER
jgi:very-short-patch-repair endonuclease